MLSMSNPTTVRSVMPRRRTMVLLIGMVVGLMGGVASPEQAEFGEPGPDTFMVNGVEIRGIERVVQVKPQYRTAGGLAELRNAFEGDTQDEIVFMLPDSTLWLAYGRHINLYTRTVDRIETASYGGVPVHVLILDDEVWESDSRVVLGRGMALLLVAIVLLGLTGGIILGYIVRRNLGSFSHGPLVDRAIYGLIIGIVVALLVYGLSNRKLDLRGLFKGLSSEEFAPYTVTPPSD